MRFLAVILLTLYLAKVDASSVQVKVTLSPTGSFVAKTGDVTGFATETKSIVSAKDVRVKVKGLQTGVALRDKHLLKRLDSEKFPEIILVKASGRSGKGTGVIKIKGIEKPISGTYKITNNICEAVFPLKISEFGIDDVSYMGVGVDDEVEISVSIPLKKSP